MFNTLKRYPQAGGNLVVYARDEGEVDEILTAFRACARGRYQLDCARGAQRWSGADLQGKASRYAGRYATSRANILDRAKQRGMVVVSYKDKAIHGLCRVALGIGRGEEE